MKRLLFLFPLLISAQVTTIPNTTFPAVRSMMNANFGWLNTNKAGNSACPANQYAIQTTTAGVVCASLTSGQLTTALGFTPAPVDSPTFTGTVTIGASLPAGWQNVSFWGDSLTEGSGATTATAFPAQLGNLAGKTAYNGGVGGETSTQIAARFLADSAHRNWFTVIWVGRNNYSSQSTVLADVDSIVAALPTPKRFLVLSVFNSTSEPSGSAGYTQITSLNTALAAAYPNNYLDVRAPVVAAFDPGMPQDVIDHGNDVAPSSLRADALHLLSTGYAIVAQRVYAWMLSHADYVPRMVDVQTAMANGSPIGSTAAGPGSFSSVRTPNIIGTNPSAPNNGTAALSHTNDGSFQINTHFICQTDGACNLGNNSFRFGNASIKTTTTTGYLVVTNTLTPASAGANCTTGQYAWDASYIYVCTATNTWKRAAIAAW